MTDEGSNLQDLEVITLHSARRAQELAATLWALASAHYPAQHEPVLNAASQATIETISNLALNARRSMEALPANGQSFPLTQSRWTWQPTESSSSIPMVKNLREALNGVIHAQALYVGFEKLPDAVDTIDGGALVIPYVQIRTDRKELSFVDPFAVAHAFLYGPLPTLLGLAGNG